MLLEARWPFPPEGSDLPARKAPEKRGSPISSPIGEAELKEVWIFELLSDVKMLCLSKPTQLLPRVYDGTGKVALLELEGAEQDLGSSKVPLISIALAALSASRVQPSQLDPRSEKLPPVLLVNSLL